MKQIIQYQKSGEISIADLVPPQIEPGYVLVRNAFSAVSAGTEKTSVSTAQASMLGKARSRPDLLRQVMDNAKREGLAATYEKVRNRLDNYKELGYSSAGTVVESGTDDFKVGDGVACAGYAHHAELVLVPRNLVAGIPEGVSLDEASMTTIGAIAMQGVRQAGIHIGDSVAVIGLGLIGLITVQLLKANGCKVVGLDVNDTNFDLAKKFGCDLCLHSDHDSIRAVLGFSNGFGTDSVIITAGTKSNGPIELGIEFARKRAKVVIVGAVGMNLPRSPFYEKELDIRISCSYGPGRYDRQYEENGQDYPIGYVRWTERRNMEAVLDLLAQRKVEFKSLITHRIPLENGAEAYDIVTGKSKQKFLGILIQYPQASQLSEEPRSIRMSREESQKGNSSITVGFIGAGNFAQSYLIPFAGESKARLKEVVTRVPANAMAAAKKFGFEYFSTLAGEILNDKEINTVFIATHHKNHAELAVTALEQGKNVFVEKPMAINRQQLESLVAVYKKLPENNAPLLMVGFNRRFSSAFATMKKLFENRSEPMVINYRVHAGPIAQKHWLADESQGGRIVGEVCHFIDVMQFLTQADPVSVSAEKVDSPDKLSVNRNIVMSVKFSDGSLGIIQYLANGANSVPKEYCEVFCQGKTAVMDNFRQVLLFDGRSSKKVRFDGKKGHKEEVTTFLSCVRSGDNLPITFNSMYLTTLATLKIEESLIKGAHVSV